MSTWLWAMPNIVLLAGGVGGAKLAHGLQAALGSELTIVVNTGDDLERHGLAIWPDHDTVMYTLAGLDDRDRGWGLQDETWNVSGQLDRLGEDAWFRLGDRDLATHIVRTARLRMAARPTEVRTDDGWLEFQEYFVHRRQEPEVHEVRFQGIDHARPTTEVAEAIEKARAIVIAPSNPIVSVGPVLALPGIRDLIAGSRARGARVVAVSGIVGGKALKGPADRMLASLGLESSAIGVARIYADTADAFVLDQVDADQEQAS